MTNHVSDLRLGMLSYGLDRPPTGVSRYTIELISALSATMGVDPVLIGNPAPSLPNAGRYQRIDMPGARLLPGLLTIGNFTTRRASANADLNVVHDPTGNAPFLLGVGKARKIVTIQDVFALAFPGSSTLIEMFVTRFWLPLVLPQVDCVLTVSENSKKDIVNFLHYPPEKIHVTPNGTHPLGSRSPADIADILKKYDQEPGYLLMVVGSLDKRRNLPRLLEAYSRLKAGGETRHLLIVGGPKGKSRHGEYLRKFGLEDRVHFLGYVPHADMQALYSAADLFVFPSLYEGFGIPPLEAMACGTPVVTSNGSSLPEVVGDAAIMVDPYSVEAIEAGMRDALADPDLREELGRRGRLRAAEFSWERTARETLAIYLSLLG